MTSRRTLCALLASLTALAACSQTTQSSGGAVPIPGVDGSPVATDPVTATADPVAAEADDTTADTASTGDETPDAGTAAPDPTTRTDTDPETTAETTTTEAAATSTTEATTTTTTAPEPEVFAPDCVIEVEAGDSLGVIVDGFEDDTLSVSTLIGENGLDSDVIYPGQMLDICVDNGLDDVTGVERTERNPAIVAEETKIAIRAQQEKLNELFDGYGMRELLVDGISGPVTRQRLCAARVGLRLPVTLTDMEPGSDEEAAMMEADAIQVPFVSAITEPRWMLIDRTCQIMFAGSGPTQLDFVFPVSTGEQEFRTRDQDRSRAFRYDPALDNDGWHDSSDYPVPADNPLNGNMYKPLYFDRGQAIHGANNVPTTPQSKGCVRMRPENQDALVAWLGLADAAGPTNDSGRIGAVVNVQGAYPFETLDEAEA
ncbi:L,D-transpeptidase family protein [Ilumatobacter sp.]|uniref:L,D-transpeptidase family protein n=1 Tax=Ilumatobacter sp. TaxID=1967498 RepID=UPI003B527EE2